MNPLIVPHPTRLSPLDRSQLKNHQPAVIWLTGLSASGKSTLANEVEVQLNRQYGAHTYLLDGDTVRSGLNSDLGFTAADRTENIRRMGEVARLFVEAGLIVLTAFISPFRTDRAQARARVPEGLFFEVYVRCPLAVCAQRDPKGLYQKAREGRLRDFTGIDSPYEEPLAPELTVDTSVLSVAASGAAVLQFLERQGVIVPLAGRQG